MRSCNLTFGLPHSLRLSTKKWGPIFSNCIQSFHEEKNARAWWINLGIRQKKREETIIKFWIFFLLNYFFCHKIIKLLALKSELALSKLLLFKLKEKCPYQYLHLSCRHRAQSFTSLKADLCQDINRDFAFSRCFNETFHWRKYSVNALVSWLRREDLYLLLFSFGLMY